MSSIYKRYVKTETTKQHFIALYII